MRSPLAAFGLAVCVLGGCGARGAATVDGGPPDAATGGRRSFQIMSTLSPAPTQTAPPSQLPPGHAFTLVLDPKEGRIIVGANGSGVVVPVTTTDGRTFKTLLPVAVRTAAVGACAGATSVTYQSLEVTVTGGGLAGKGAGNAEISCGDCSFQVPFQATLAGTPDVTPPSLLAQGSSGTLSSFSFLSFVASEPMPTNVTARLVAGDGSQLELEPTVQQGDVPLVVGFRKPDVVLSAGQGYAVTLDGLVDFAGHAGSADAPLRLATTPAAPLVAEDGFEGVTGAMLGGATVVKDPFATVATKSLYVGGAQAPSLDGAAAGGSLVVRLALQPGDTKVRFTARSVGGGRDFGFAGTVAVGSAGHQAVADRGVQNATSGKETTAVPGGAMIFVTDTLLNEIPLPADVTDEVILQIAPSRFDCGPSLPVGGLLIDDLRAE